MFSGKLYKMADNVYQYNHLQILPTASPVKMPFLKEQVFNLERSVQRHSG